MYPGGGAELVDSMGFEDVCGIVVAVVSVQVEVVNFESVLVTVVPLVTIVVSSKQVVKEVLVMEDVVYPRGGGAEVDSTGFVEDEEGGTELVDSTGFEDVCGIVVTLVVVDVDVVSSDERVLVTVVPLVTMVLSTGQVVT